MNFNKATTATYNNKSERNVARRTFRDHTGHYLYSCSDTMLSKSFEYVEALIMTWEKE